MSFTNFDERRLDVAREVMLYNQDNWQETLLNYTDNSLYMKMYILNNDENNRFKISGIDNLTYFMKNLLTLRFSN